MRTIHLLALLIMTPAIVNAEVATFNVDGVARKAFLYAPSVAAPASGFPVVFAFHGRGDVIENFEIVGLERAMPDAIVVYFQGLDRNGLSGWQTERGMDNDRDLKLVDTALATLRKRYSIDENRIYATGFSNGSGFTFLLWAERPNVFAALAVVAGRMRPNAQPKQQKPIMFVAGVNDPQTTYADARAGIVTAIAINGVRSSSMRCGNGCMVYGQGTTAPVLTYVHQGGHEYPRGTAERIAAFFADHRKK
jgi:polyhydroxybutyrate depolymerase